MVLLNIVARTRKGLIEVLPDNGAGIEHTKNRKFNYNLSLALKNESRS
jgi:hypothetical protein